MGSIMSAQRQVVFVPEVSWERVWPKSNVEVRFLAESRRNQTTGQFPLRVDLSRLPNPVLFFNNARSD